MTDHPPSDSRKGTYALVSLGCPKNLVDSERMAGLLRLDGYQMVASPRDADLVIVNTCGFVADARRESFGVIEEMVQLKRRKKLRGLIVAGCLAQRDKESLLEKYPEIDQLVGVFAREEIAQAAQRITDGLAEQRLVFRPAPIRPLPDTERLRITPRHLAFLKIAEGCNRTCSFCAIPKMRGEYVSKSIDEVVAEAEQLADDGVRELILVAQDTTFYGLDTERRPVLADLLRRLDRVSSLAWIRLMYLYPMHITDELLDAIASSQRVLPYLDLPLQHINDQVLTRMRRPVSRMQTEALLDRLRRRIPGLALRTTFITGFPGETKAQFEELLQFVRNQRFERLGAFAYSAEPGTPAAELDGMLPQSVRDTRRDKLLAVQQEIAFDWNKAQIGRRLPVIIDRAVPDEPDAFVGRSRADAPEVDPVVYVTGRGLAAGQIVDCEIVASHGYDLVGAAAEPSTP